MSQHSSKGREWTRIAQGVMDRDGHVCQYQFGNCSYDHDLTVDHITPKVNGGTDDEWNLTTACRSCNGKKKDKTLLRVTWVDREWMAA